MPILPRFERILTSVRSELYPVVAALTLVAALSLFLLVVAPIFNLERVTIFFLVPILVSATRWGTVGALACSIGGVASLAFFFYPPRFSFYVADPDHIVNLILFVGIALLTSHLAGSLKRQAAELSRREKETRELYQLSRHLALAHSASEIYEAVQNHLASSLHRKVMLFRSETDAKARGDSCVDPGIPELIRRGISAMPPGGDHDSRDTIMDTASGTSWLVRPISPTKAEFGVIAVDLGTKKSSEIEAMKRQIESVLAYVETTLNHLNVDRAIREAELRAETDRLREALIGSVSHELRSPLTSILCSASILRAVPALAADTRLAGLVDAIRQEAERHNNDIQNLLDASRISSRGVKPEYEWCDPTDIVNAATERVRLRYSDRHLKMNLQGDVPLLFVDSMLTEQALMQVIDNAAKYSSSDSTIEITTQAGDDKVRLVIKDQGAGLTEAEKAGMWNQFFRGHRHTLSSAGSGLGLWVAHAFVTANGGTIQAASEGEGRGTTVSIEFPLVRRPEEGLMQFEDASHE